MRKSLYYCDKCGKEFAVDTENKTGHLSVLIKTPDTLYNSGRNNADLCLDCYNELCDLVEEFNLKMVDFTNLDNDTKTGWKQYIKKNREISYEK